jgi:hypothetical protein
MADERAPPLYIDYRPGDETGPFWLHLPRLRRLLAAHGLSVVAASGIADECAPLDTPPGSVRRYLRPGEHVVSAADQAVLEAGNLVLDSSLRRIADENGGCLADWAKAELARRAVKR